MIDKLVTYHIHKRDPLSANDALAYQYAPAGNGVFVRAETRFFTVLLLITSGIVRGRPDNGLNEVLYQFHHHGRAVQVKKPAQQITPTSVATSVTTAVADAASIICDLHSYGNMRAFFLQTDNADGQGTRLHGVIGRLDSEPEKRLCVGVYGFWLALPLTAVFTTNGPFDTPNPDGPLRAGPFKDLYQEKDDDKQRL